MLVSLGFILLRLATEEEDRVTSSLAPIHSSIPPTKGRCMTLARRFLAAVATSAFFLAVGTLAPLSAQDPATTKADAKPARKPYDPARRVPPYFGQVGLSSDQKESIYKVRARHLEKIDALQKQLDEAKAAMMADCEALLTDAQRKLLADRRADARQKAQARTAAAKAEPKKPAEETKKTAEEKKNG